jgi:hypothetical protein
MIQVLEDARELTDIPNPPFSRQTRMPREVKIKQESKNIFVIELGKVRNGSRSKY